MENFSKSENYENYLTGNKNSFAEYKVNGVMVKIEPVSTANMLAQSYSYDLGEGKWEPISMHSYANYVNAYTPIRNYRWITRYVDHPTTDFVLITSLILRQCRYGYVGLTVKHLKQSPDLL